MTEEGTSATKDAWREVGQQFQTLGESLANAFRTMWEDEENRQHAQDLQAGLEKMVNDVGKAIKETSESPEGQKVRAEAQKAAESARVAGKKAMQDTRPHILSALRALDSELQKMIDKLETEKE
jgi:hypothetical protein